MRQAADAIAGARDRIIEAIRALEEEDNPGLSLELLQACTDDIARALWFLRRAQREKT